MRVRAGSATAVGIAALFVVLSPASVAAQDVQGLVTINATSATELRAWDASIDRLVREGELLVRAAYDDTLLAGRRHERLSQYYRGVPVYGGDISRQTAGGLTVSIFGTFYARIDLDPTPALSAEAATTTLERVSGATLVLNRPPRLTILPTLDGSYALTYRATMSNARTYFIDARTGSVVLEFSELRQQSAVGSGTGVLGDRKKVSVNRRAGTFQTRDLLRPAEVLTLDMRGDAFRLDDLLLGFQPFAESDIATDTDNNWMDPGVVDTHANMGFTYDYFFKRHEYDGLDDRNARPIGFINIPQRTPLLGFVGNNAFFIPPPFGPEGLGAFVFGDSGGTPLVALDIVGHELMHGVTHFSVSRRTGMGLRDAFFVDIGPDSIGGVPCDSSVRVAPDGRRLPAACDDGRYLLAFNHGGAINEAFSDIFGTSLEFFFEEPGSGPLRADYLIGEDSPFGAIRRLDDPQSLSIFRSSSIPLPDNDSQALRFLVLQDGARQILSDLVFFGGDIISLPGNDDGALHWNSTILSHAFYLAIEGGENRTSRRVVLGVGAANRDQIEQVFFRAMTQLMPSFPSFSIAAAVICQSARDLFGPGSTVSRAVDEALSAVGL